MKSLITRAVILTALFSTTILTSQVTLNSANFNLLTQDSVRSVEADTTGVLMPNEGANLIWDYSGLVTSQKYKRWIGPDISQSVVDTAFPTATGVIISSTSDYFTRLDANELVILGIYQKQGAPYIQKTTDPKTILKFPMTYGSMYTDSVKSYFNFQGQTGYANEQIISEVVGYGELRLPGMVYPNVLLVKNLESGTSVSPAGDVFIRNAVEYLFYSPGLYTAAFSYLEVNGTSNGNPLPKGKRVAYFDEITFIDISEFTIYTQSLIEAFPLPTRDLLYLEGIDSETHYFLFDINGLVIEEGILDENDSVLDLSHRTPGVLYYQVRRPGVYCLYPGSKGIGKVSE